MKTLSSSATRGVSGDIIKLQLLASHKKVWVCAQLLFDTTLLSTLLEGDMVAIDAVYHLLCLNKLYQ